MFAKFKPYLKFRYFLYFYALTASWPCVLSFMGWLPPFKTGMILVAILSVIYAFMQGSRLPFVLKNIFFIQLVTYMVYSYIHADSSYITRCMILVSAYSLVLIQAKRPQLEFVKTNVFWLTLQAAMGGVGFILTMVGILKPLSTFVEYDGYVGQFYGLYTTTVAHDNILRVAGFFDEPGAFAFWGIIALLFNKLYFDNLKVEIILLIGLISTLSMAYFIMIPTYVFLFYRKKKYKFVILSLLFLLILKAIASLGSGFDYAIWGRFQMDTSTGLLAGDNRTHHAEFCKSIWLERPFFGVGGHRLIQISHEQGRFAGANPYTFLAMDGIVGGAIRLLPLFYIFFLGLKQSKYARVGIILSLGLLQRPYDPTQLLYPLIFLTICYEGYRDVYVPERKDRRDFI